MFYIVPLSSLQEVHNTHGNFKVTCLWKILWVYNLNILFLCLHFITGFVCGKSKKELPSDDVVRWCDIDNTDLLGYL